LDLLSKVKRDTLTLLIVRDVLSFPAAVRLEFRALDLELMRIEHNVVPFLIILNVEVDRDRTLVAKVASIFDIV
jgi:hypothetical protein